MWLTVAVGVFFFVGMIAVVYFGVQQGEQDRAEKAAAEALAGAGIPDGRSVEEVVFDLEHRIEADLREVAERLRHGQVTPAGRIHRAQG